MKHNERRYVCSSLSRGIWRVYSCIRCRWTYGCVGLALLLSVCYCVFRADAMGRCGDGRDGRFRTRVRWFIPGTDAMARSGIIAMGL